MNPIEAASPEEAHTWDVLLEVGCHQVPNALSSGGTGLKLKHGGLELEAVQSIGQRFAEIVFITGIYRDARQLSAENSSHALANEGRLANSSTVDICSRDFSIRPAIFAAAAQPASSRMDFSSIVRLNRFCITFSSTKIRVNSTTMRGRLFSGLIVGRMP